MADEECDYVVVATVQVVHQTTWVSSYGGAPKNLKNNNFSQFELSKIVRP